MKTTLIILLLSLPMPALAQIKDTIRLPNGKYYLCNCRITTTKQSYLLDTIHHDRKGDFTLIGKDTIRNGVYEYYLIKKRLKKKKQ